MELTIRIESGDAAGRVIPVPAGPMLRFGRLGSADVRLTDDPTLSGEHFGVRCDEAGGHVQDLGSRFGTLVNGTKVAEAALRDGDEIRAGRTVFSVSLVTRSTRVSLCSVKMITLRRAPVESRISSASSRVSRSESHLA